MEHIRSRSHSLVNIRSRNNNKNNKNNKNKQYEMIKFKCMDEKNDNNNNNNGIVGIYITSTFVSNIFNFWNDNIILKSYIVECATLFFSHFIVNIASSCFNCDNDNLKRLLNDNDNNVKYFDMIGWLLRLLINNEINAYQTLIEIGKIHLNAYSTCEYSYRAMLNAIHCTFCSLFEKEYSVSLRYMIDIVFMRSIQIMNSNGDVYDDEKYKSLMSLDFLDSLDLCLVDDIGIQYLFHFLNQSYCKEISIFLALYHKFKDCCAQNDALRCKMAMKIYNECIVDSAQYQINVAFSTYQQIKCAIQNENDALAPENDIFENAYHQIKRLIIHNHWTNFKQTLRALKQKQVKMNE